MSTTRFLSSEPFWAILSHPPDEAHGVGREAQPLGDIIRTGRLDPFGRPLGVDHVHHRARAGFRFVQSLFVQGKPTGNLVSCVSRPTRRW